MYSPSNVIKRIGMVKTIHVLKYVQHEILIPFWDKTCNHTKVAREPIDVIFGPKSDPITFAYTSATRITPVVSVSAIAIASIITVGILFIIEDSIAATTAIATAAKTLPRSALPATT